MVTKEKTTVTLDADLLAKARERGLKISPACEKGLANAIEQHDAEQNVVADTSQPVRAAKLYLSLVAFLAEHQPLRTPFPFLK